MATIVQYALALFCLLVLMQKGDAYEFVVGGQNGWSVPSDPNANPYNQWAEKSRFQVGDSLVFNYQSGKDSIIQVNSQQDYESCNTDAASSAKASDGHTVIKLNKSGPHYFISGNKNNCLKNEKLLVIVLADRTNNSNTNQTTPPPSPSVSVSPSPSPLSSHSSDALAPILPPVQQVGLTPPPIQQVGSSPPLGTDVTNPITPTPAPVTQPPPPPPNTASSILVSFGCSVGALMVSVLVFFK
ncbi:early nodulin protein [Trifolium repens]|nr:early nodulin protein [Trifolium repens]